MDKGGLARYFAMVDKAFNKRDGGVPARTDAADVTIDVNCDGDRWSGYDCALAPGARKYAYRGWETHSIGLWVPVAAMLRDVYNPAAAIEMPASMQQ